MNILGNLFYFLNACSMVRNGKFELVLFVFHEEYVNKLCSLVYLFMFDEFLTIGWLVSSNSDQYILCLFSSYVKRIINLLIK